MIKIILFFIFIYALVTIFDNDSEKKIRDAVADALDERDDS